MKKIIIILAFAAATTAGAYAQATFALGVKGGVNFANVNASSAQATFDNRTGYHFGAFALFKGSRVGIQPEVLFSQQGSKVKVNNNDFDANFSYINIPVIVKLYTVAGINLQVGPQFGFLSRAEIESIDSKDDFKNSDVSLALGAGWDLPFGLTIDARYNLGLTEINENSAEFQKVKNQVWQISAGFKILDFGRGK